MKTTVAFSVLAAVAMVAIPMSASADCAGHHQSKVVSKSQPAPVAAVPATEPAGFRTAQAEQPVAAPASSSVVADMAAADEASKDKAE